MLHNFLWLWALAVGSLEKTVAAGEEGLTQLSVPHCSRPYILIVASIFYLLPDLLGCIIFHKWAPYIVIIARPFVVVPAPVQLVNIGIQCSSKVPAVTAAWVQG